MVPRDHLETLFRTAGLGEDALCLNATVPLHGIGNLLAGKILARVGDIDRFRSAAAFASYTGTAPIEVSSGDVVRHRLSRAGDRQLNSCLHTRGHHPDRP